MEAQPGPQAWAPRTPVRRGSEGLGPGLEAGKPHRGAMGPGKGEEGHSLPHRRMEPPGCFHVTGSDMEVWATAGSREDSEEQEGELGNLQDP